MTLLAVKNVSLHCAEYYRVLLGSQPLVPLCPEQLDSRANYISREFKQRNHRTANGERVRKLKLNSGMCGSCRVTYAHTEERGRDGIKVSVLQMQMLVQLQHMDEVYLIRYSCKTSLTYGYLISPMKMRSL